jgi:hypothetical protein
MHLDKFETTHQLSQNRTSSHKANRHQKVPQGQEKQVVNSLVADGWFSQRDSTQIVPSSTHGHVTSLGPQGNQDLHQILPNLHYTPLALLTPSNFRFIP